jgi:hypothetical protein
MNSMNFLRKIGLSATRQRQPKRKLRSKLGSERLGCDRLEERCLMAADVVIAVPDLAATTTGQAVAINVLANDIAPSSDKLTPSVAVQPLHGTAAVGSNNQITYTPAANFSGFDAFVYTDTSSNGGKGSAPVGVLVSGTPAENFIVNLYNDVLHRLPTTSEISSWIQNIGSQTLGSTLRTDIATGFLNSAESHLNTIKADFMKFLGRTGDTSGISFFTNELANGIPALNVDMSFLNSAEFSALHTSASDFVNSVFSDVLGRLPTASDTSFFTNELSTLTRAQVVQQIVLSSENVQNIVASDVQAFVGRTPTASELAAAQGIIQGIAQGTNLQMEVSNAASLLGSSEFFSKIV